MKKMVIFAVVAGLLCWVPGASAQTKIRAEGMAVVSNNRVDIAREKALDGALRSAVEKVVGVMVTSTSEVENFQLKMDRILSESRGFINTYTIISEKMYRDRRGDQFEVIVEADVGRERLRGRLEAINLIPPAQPFSAINANIEAPVITITKPEVRRGLKITAKEAAITVAGRATDQNGVASVTVNEQNADLDENGNFTTDILLKVGENQIIVTAMNVQRKKGTQKFAIIREQTKVASGVQESTSTMREKQSIITRLGKYHALVIGNNDYSYLTKLQTAVNDAREVARILKDWYGFETRLILNAKRKDILSTMNEYRKNLSKDDNLLIYYAGHGEYEKVANKAYWLPVDARRDDTSEWIIADEITSNVKRIASKHILIISDSCYSGTIDRNVETDLRQKTDRDEYIKKMMDRPSRTLLASGGNEPVSDSGGGNHSIFADSLLKALKEIDRREFTVDELFYQHVRSRVAGRSEQVPEYKEIRNSGHEGGDFVFFKKE